MSRRRAGTVPAIALLVVLAVLFAPNREEQPANPVRLAPDSVEALIVAPTVGAGILAAGPRLWSPRLRIADHSPRGAILPTVPSVAAVLFVSLTWLARRDSPAAPRGVALRPSVPRGPPALRTA